VSFDLEIQLKLFVRITLTFTTCLYALILVGADCHGQVPVGRYPLHGASQPVQRGPAEYPTLGQKSIQVIQPALEENATGNAPIGQSPDNAQSSSLEPLRAKFAKQFEQARADIASAQSVDANKTHLTRPNITPDQSNVFERGQGRHVPSKYLLHPQAVSPASLNVMLLPELKDGPNRYPRVASRQPDLASDRSNDFPIDHTHPPRPTPQLESQLSKSVVQKSESLNWWNDLVTQPLHPENQVQTVDSNALVYMALQNSPRIQSLSRDPLIRDFEVIEADAAFDPISFLQSQFADRSDPIGGALDATRDGLSTIENHRWTAEGGVRKRGRTGATYELSQRLGFENSNVSVFDPNNQGTAQLALNVTQPLARGRGRYITQSQILLAQSRGGEAWETFSADLQEEIETIVAAYWRLYYDRSVFLQTKRNVERAAKILETLEGRAKLDSLPNQITRARSSVQTRKTELANAFRDVRNSETELRRLIADRNWRANQFVELLPIEPPFSSALDISLDHVVTTSLENRPEIRASLQEAKRAGIERDISTNDLLPELSLLLGTYVSTLTDRSRVGDAFVDQFGQTKPGYSVGLEFELPIGNRAARSRLVQRKLQLAKIKNEVDETIQNVIAESQIALRRVNSAAETFQAANQAIEAARSDLEQNFLRWENFALVEGDFADGQTPTTVLDQLLDSQERLSSAEAVAAQSQLELKIAEVALQRSMGTLLIQRRINPQRAFEAGSPLIQF